MVYGEGLFNIKPTDPLSLCSESKITDRLNESSPKIDGSAINNFPFDGFNTVIVYIKYQ